MLSEYRSTIHQKNPSLLWVSYEPHKAVWEKILCSRSCHNQSRIRPVSPDPLIHPDHVGSGLKTSQVQDCLLTNTSRLPSAHRSCACWHISNPNTQVTGQCWTWGAVNRSLNTHSSHTRDCAPRLQGFKELTSLPEVSLSPWLGLLCGQIRLAPNGGIWPVVRKLGTDPRLPIHSGALESHPSLSARFFLWAVGPLQDQTCPLDLSRREKREKTDSKNTEFSTTYRGSSYPFLQQTLAMQAKLS